MQNNLNSIFRIENNSELAKIIIYTNFALYAIVGIVLCFASFFTVWQLIMYELLGVVTTFTSYVLTFIDTEKETD